MAGEFRTPYRGYDVLAKRDTPSWNAQTREVIEARLTRVPARRFLAPEAWRTLEAVCARIVPQPDRPERPVPIAPWIDQQLEEGTGEGFRFEDMPPQREAWQRGLAGIDDEARRRFGAAFSALVPECQDAVLRAVQCGEVVGAAWEHLPPQRFFEVTLLPRIVGTYYAHPDAWSEVGFGGPASPRGYARLGPDQRDPWEAKAHAD